MLLYRHILILENKMMIRGNLYFFSSPSSVCPSNLFLKPSAPIITPVLV